MGLERRQQRGSQLTSTVTAAVLSRSAEPVTLSATGAPSGVCVSFDPPSVTGGSTSTMTMTASATAVGDLMSMFDGKTLDGWTASKAGRSTVKKGTIPGAGLVLL